MNVRVQQFVPVRVPMERRTRRETVSFSMPPAVISRLTRFARQRKMSRSDLLTFLCVDFLDAAESLGKRAGRRPRTAE